MSIEALSGKVFLVVTGASRGIGRQIAITFGSLLQEDSRVLLLARDLNALQQVAQSIPSKVIVNVASMDLGKVTKSDLEGAILESLKGSTREAFDRVVVVHNAGSSISKPLNELTAMNDWRTYYDMNFFSVIMLNTMIMNLFDDRTNTKKLIINITSIFAKKPIAGMGYYCTGKAAREMYFKVFAVENPNVNVLSYSPGPVDTDLFNSFCESIIDATDKITYCKIRDSTVLSTEKTINRLLEILKAHKYEPADHVDYYDQL